MPVEEFLEFKSPGGGTIAVAKIVAESKGRPFLRLTAAQAAENGEEALQLLEGVRYQYELDKPGYSIEETAIARRFLVGVEDRDRGELSTGLHTGLLRLYVVESGQRVAMASVEVRSAKLNYREEYRAMLERIAEASLDLLAYLPETSQVRLEMDENASAESIQQQFFFIRGLLEGEEFSEAIARILRTPHSRLISVADTRNLSKSFRATQNLGRELAAAGRRLPLPATHPLAGPLSGHGKVIPSLPSRIAAVSLEETVDTPENRFVKFVLNEFFDALDLIARRLEAGGTANASFASREVEPLRMKIGELLNHDLFEDVRSVEKIAFSSPVLQRKAGYREILRSWLRFSSTARLVWSGGDDVFGGGKRDVATLYEYWLFFVLWDVVSARLGDAASELLSKGILEQSTNGFGLKLKTGRFFPANGFEILHNGVRLSIQFSYNRTFKAAETRTVSMRIPYSGNHPEPGSWTKAMRPDFTLSIWPASLDCDRAELEEAIAHVHFDAKYSVDFVEELFGPTEIDLGDEKRLQRAGSYKRADLLKMHAYKDAIRRSQGAYILYPGSASEPAGGNSAWREYHEVLPGLGAFIVRPQQEAEGKATLQAFLSDILDHLADKHRPPHS